MQRIYCNPAHFDISIQEIGGKLPVECLASALLDNNLVHLQQHFK